MLDYLAYHHWIVIVAFAMLGLVFVVLGLSSLVEAGLALKDRAVALAELELMDTIDATIVKLDRTQASVDGIPLMVVRAKNALLSIKSSRERLQRQVQTATAAFNLARAIFTPSKPR